uniref:Uncharacterized protein n=1 Tax=Candidatus Kentrum sp. FW TaxID=2126338 RepID=A0A450TQE9_9GAMM|nr:MAG: hypothetical protein BECKFW1821C_GA0114237_102217 [Candidatus Kentron sp. FW]
MRLDRNRQAGVEIQYSLIFLIMKRPSFVHKGNRYHLTHLDSFDWHYRVKAGRERPDWICKFQVIFSDHCFTRNPFSGEEVAEDMWHEGPRGKRVFCFKRYELSFRLPEIIRTLGERVCYRTPHGNFLTVVALTIREGKQVEYEIYFDVVRASRKGWLHLIVQSAYERTKDHETMRKKRKIRLDVIAYNRRVGKAIRSGP